jgi:hypothetical protein
MGGGGEQVRASTKDVTNKKYMCYKATFRSYM